MQTKIVCDFKALTSIALKPVTEVVKFVTGTPKFMLKNGLESKIESQGV